MTITTQRSSASINEVSRQNDDEKSHENIIVTVPNVTAGYPRTPVKTQNYYQVLDDDNSDVLPACDETFVTSNISHTASHKGVCSIPEDFELNFNLLDISDEHDHRKSTRRKGAKRRRTTTHRRRKPLRGPTKGPTSLGIQSSDQEPSTQNPPEQTAQEGFKSIPPKSKSKDVESQDLTPDLLEAFSALSKLVEKSSSYSGLVLRRLEDAALHIYLLTQIQDESGALAVLAAYCKTFMSTSLTETALSFFTSLFREELEVQYGSETPDWLLALRSAHRNWGALVHNPVFKRISLLLSAAVTLGICDANSLKWDVGGVRVFDLAVSDRYLSTTSLLDAVLETVVFFVEGGHACFTTRSLAPLFYSNFKGLELENEYALVSSCLPLVRAGNLKKIRNMTDHELDTRIAKLATTYNELYLTCREPWERKTIENRIRDLTRLRSDFNTIRVQGGLRIQPYGITMYGASSVGKSTVCGISLISILKANNIPCEDQDIVTVNESDKFMSNYQSSVTGVIIDDIGNTKSDFVEKAPTQRIIEMCNNIRSYANMAEIDLKGKVAIEPLVVVMTTNVKNLCATTYSNEPVSICRRSHVVLTIKVKPEFCASGISGSLGHMLDQEKVERFFTDAEGIVDIPTIPDLWHITAERVVAQPSQIGNAHHVGHQVIFHNGKLLEDVSIYDVLHFMIADSKKHFHHQEVLVERNNNFAAKLDMCKCHNLPQDVCTKVYPQLERQFGLLDPFYIVNEYFDAQYAFPLALQYTRARLWDPFQQWLSFDIVADKAHVLFQSLETYTCLELLRWLEYSPYTFWTSYIPSTWLTHPAFRRITEWVYADQIAYNLLFWIKSSVFFAVLSIYGIYRSYIHDSPMMLSLFFVCLVISLVALHTRVHLATASLHEQIASRSDAMPLVIKTFRDNHSQKFFAIGATLVAIVAAIKLYRTIRGRTPKVVQSALDPVDEQEITIRDAQTNPWLGVSIAPLPASDRAKTMAFDDVLRLVATQTLHMTVVTDGTTKASDAFFVCSNVAIIPNHVWATIPDNDFIATFTKYDPKVVGATFRSVISKTHSYHVPDTDLCYVWVPGGGSWKDLSHLLPLATLRDCPAELVYRNIHGELKMSPLHARICTTGPSHLVYVGATYDLRWPTFVGMCMAPVVSKSKQHVLVGFHLAGTVGHTYGACGTLFYSQHVMAMSSLESKRGIVLAPNAGTIPTSTYDIPWFVSPTVHRKSPVNYLEGAPNITVYGTVVGRTSPRTSICDSPISEAVTSVCGVPQLWGPPQYTPSWRPYQRNLQVCSQPAAGVEAHLLVEAIGQYLAPLRQKAKTDYWQTNLRPLTDLEVVCGCDNERFIDRMNMGTSVGFPLFKPKRDFLTLLDPLLYPDHASPAELDKMFWEEAHRYEAAYLKGERAYPIYNACLKDEPTKKTKDKVRVFQSAPVALQLLMRKYFLKIARFLSTYPKLSKMAVGINAFSPEWEEMFLHIGQYGEERVLAGDYAQFDQRMPAQSILVAFSVFIEIARMGQFSDADITIMKGLAADVAYALVNFNGTLIQFCGMHCSGENMTVYINCLQSILNVYCFVLQSYPDASVDDVVAFITYGDDNIGTVSEKYPLINHINFAAWLAVRDQVFTMPDKVSVPTPYMSLKYVDFLKRKNVYIPEIECNVGALDENSIFKSLHCIRANPALTNDELAVLNIDGALREWFFHGRETFTLRQSQMAEVLTMTGLISGEAHLSFDARVEMWKDKYRPSLP